MKKTCFAVAFLIVLLSLLAPLTAEEVSPDPFTEKELDSFIADWPQFTSWIEEKGKTIENIENPALLLSMLAGLSAENYLRDKGWDPERFYYIAGRATMALAVIRAQEQMPDLIRQIDSAIEEVRSNTEASEEEKRAAIKDLEEVKASLLGLDTFFEVSEREVELVRARRDELRTMFGTE